MFQLKFGQFERNQTGTIIVFASLALMTLLMVIGMAMEFSRIQNIKSVTVSAAQAAILSAAKLYPEKCGVDFLNPVTVATPCVCPNGAPIAPASMVIPVHPSFINTYSYVFSENSVGFTMTPPTTNFRATCSVTVDASLNRTGKVYDFYASGTTDIDTIFLGLFGYSKHNIGFKVHANRRD